MPEETMQTLDIARIRNMQTNAELLAAKESCRAMIYTPITWGYFNGSTVYRCLPMFNSEGRRIVRHG